MTKSIRSLIFALLALTFILTACGQPVTSTSTPASDSIRETWIQLPEKELTAICMTLPGTVLGAPLTGGCIAMIPACKVAAVTGQEMPYYCGKIAEAAIAASAK